MVTPNCLQLDISHNKRRTRAGPLVPNTLLEWGRGVDRPQTPKKCARIELTNSRGYERARYAWKEIAR